MLQQCCSTAIQFALTPCIIYRGQGVHTLSEVSQADSPIRINLCMAGSLEEWRLLAVRVEIHLVTSPDLLHAGLREAEEPNLVKLDAADNGEGLGEHVLPLVLVMHVHRAEEHIILGVRVDPAKEDDVLLVMDVPDILQPLHGAGV